MKTFENLTEVSKAFEVERERSIHYDNIHAGAIVTERNRLKTVEHALWKLSLQVCQFEFLLFIFVLIVFLLILCRKNGRRPRF